MKNKTLEPKTDTQAVHSPYQAEKAEAQAVPVSRPARGGEALLRLQRRVGNRAVQRLLVQCQEPEEEEELQFKRLAQRRGGGAGFDLDDETAGRINRARGGGQPLDGAVQAQMSEALGYDFSGVRVHTDPEAHTLNRQLSARAFTTGHDIFFRRGEYNPGSGNGRELIAHELTHVVQQSTGRVSGGGSGMTVRPAGDGFEQEAASLARQATAELRRRRDGDVKCQEVVAGHGREIGRTGGKRRSAGRPIPGSRLVAPTKIQRALATTALTPLPPVLPPGLAITCHVATWYWAAQEAQARALTPPKAPQVSLGNIAALPLGPQQQMLALPRVGVWNFPGAALPPIGTVLRWDAPPTHSAVVTGPNAIRGYNQAAMVAALGRGLTTMSVADLPPPHRLCDTVAEDTIVNAAGAFNL